MPECYSAAQILQQLEFGFGTTATWHVTIAAGFIGFGLTVLINPGFNVYWSQCDVIVVVDCIDYWCPL